MENQSTIDEINKVANELKEMESKLDVADKELQKAQKHLQICTFVIFFGIASLTAAGLGIVLIILGGIMFFRINKKMLNLAKNVAFIFSNVEELRSRLDTLHGMLDRFDVIVESKPFFLKNQAFYNAVSRTKNLTGMELINFAKVVPVNAAHGVTKATAESIKAIFEKTGVKVSVRLAQNAT